MHVREAEEWCGRVDAILLDELDGDGEVSVGKKRYTSAEMAEVILQGEALTVHVGSEQALRLRLWRLQCKEALKSNGNLHELQELCAAAEKTGLSLDDPALAQGSPSGADGGERPPSRQGMRGRSSGPVEEASRSASDLADGGSKGGGGGGTGGRADEERVKRESALAQEELTLLRELVSVAESWQKRAERVLTTDKVAIGAMEQLLLDGRELPIVMDEQKWLEASLGEARAWLAATEELESPAARLEEVQRHIKEYSKVNLLSHKVESLKARAAQADAWLESVRALYKVLPGRPPLHTREPFREHYGGAV